jgi:hypothetical protein
MSATQYQPGPVPVRRSRTTLFIVIGVMSMVLMLGGIGAVLMAKGGGGGGGTPDPPVGPHGPNPPVVPTATPTPPQPPPTPTPTPPPPSGDEQVDPNRVCAADPLLPPPDTETIKGSEFKIYDTSKPPNGVPDVAVTEASDGSMIVIVDPDEQGTWDEGGTCQNGTYVQID